MLKAFWFGVSNQCHTWKPNPRSHSLTKACVMFVLIFILDMKFHCFAGFSLDTSTQHELYSKSTEFIKLEGTFEVSKDKKAEGTVASVVTCSGAVIASHEAGMKDQKMTCHINTLFKHSYSKIHVIKQVLSS